MPLCGISVAPLAQISIYTLSPHQFSLVLYARISIAEGKYHAVRHIACAVGANIDLLEYPLIHRRRDDGPPAPRRSRPLFVTLSACHLSRYRESLPHKARQSRAGEGWFRTTFNLRKLMMLPLCSALPSYSIRRGELFLSTRERDILHRGRVWRFRR